LPPLTYKIQTFTANYQLQAYVVFNRAVNMTLAQFSSTVQIQFNGSPLKSNQFTASVFNSTTYLVKFPSSMSLNENALSFSFTPGSITDQYGNVLTTVTVSQNVTIVTGLNAQVASVTQPVKDVTMIVSVLLLALLILLLVKSSYAGLIAL
jgi:hypothetical protein